MEEMRRRRSWVSAQIPNLFDFMEQLFCASSTLYVTFVQSILTIVIEQALFVDILRNVSQVNLRV